MDRFVDPQDRIRAKLARLAGARDAESLARQIAAVRGAVSGPGDPERFSFGSVLAQTTPVTASTTSTVTYATHAVVSPVVPRGRWRTEVVVVATYQQTSGFAVGVQLTYADDVNAYVVADTTPLMGTGMVVIFLSLTDQVVVSDGVTYPSATIAYRTPSGGTAVAGDVLVFVTGHRMTS